MPRVLIIDDDPALLEAVRDLLVRTGYETVGVSTAVQGLEAARRQDFDVVITDLVMPGIGGLELIQLLRSLDPTLPVIVLTGNATMESAIAAMRHAGAYDFLQKPVIEAATFESAVAKAFVHSQRLRNQLGLTVAPERKRAIERLAGLTNRERELLSLLARGLDNEQIAETVCLGRKTIRNYLSNLYGKLGVENRTQAVLLHGLAGAPT